MIETPEIIESPAQRTAYIHLVIPRDQIQHQMGPAIGELMSTVAAQGVQITGPWLSHHLTVAPESWDFRVSVPVASPVTPAGRVQPGELPAARVARTVYQGGYEGLGEGWGELMSWIEAESLETRSDFWERYVVGPESSPNPEDWRTELNRPLAG